MALKYPQHSRCAMRATDCKNVGLHELAEPDPELRAATNSGDAVVVASNVFCNIIVERILGRSNLVGLVGKVESGRRGHNDEGCIFVVELAENGLEEALVVA